MDYFDILFSNYLMLLVNIFRELVKKCVLIFYKKFIRLINYEMKLCICISFLLVFSF